MKIAFPFRSRLAFGGEILTQQATFLPVESAESARTGRVCASEMQHLANYLPVFKLNGKNMTVAQPLLMEELR